MKFDVIGSSSKGNCIIMEHKIMFDCGVSYSKVKDYIKDIKLIFISHVHTDHLLPSTVKKIAYEKPNVKFIVGKPVVNGLLKCGVLKNNIITVDTGKWYDIGLCKIRLDYLYHDAPNFCLHTQYKGKKIFYATDTARIDHVVAKDYDYYFIEANYESDEVLDMQIKEAEEKGEFTHLKRVKKTHLSQLQAINWLDVNVGENSQYMFIHQHVDRSVKSEII